MIGLIQAARLVVVNDSGPMHIAAAVGTPLVLCSGPTLPECSGPYPLTRPTHRIARAKDGDLARLGVEEVYAQAAGLLGNGRN
jgi:ADP-heptose:LPS heptosyltransferase